MTLDLGCRASLDISFRNEEKRNISRDYHAEDSISRKLHTLFRFIPCS